jgi:hypothetical protein
LVGTVIVDEDGTYEPRHPNDRLYGQARMKNPIAYSGLFAAEVETSVWRLPLNISFIR